MSAQTHGLRGYRRRKTLPDLNVPPIDGREQEGTSSQPVIQGAEGRPHSVTPAAIDVEAFDDDVIESSPRAFAVVQAKKESNSLCKNCTCKGKAVYDGQPYPDFLEASCTAKDNAQRTRRRNVVVDVDTGRTSRLTYNNRNSKRRRAQLSQAIINCDLYINLESTSSSAHLQAPSPPPPKEVTFNCPICMGPLVEETSTRCGHIFCKTCIKAAIAAQAKCPTCRKRITVKELIRVFLPATS